MNEIQWYLLEKVMVKLYPSALKISKYDEFTKDLYTIFDDFFKGNYNQEYLDSFKLDWKIRSEDNSWVSINRGYYFGIFKRDNVWGLEIADSITDTPSIVKKLEDEEGAIDKLKKIAEEHFYNNPKIIKAMQLKIS
jgi:hypothetical protein